MTVVLASATEYHVGRDQPLKALGDVPWYKLAAGDTVFIHHRPEPYHEKILISSRGNSSHWIRIIGVPGPNGELPVISGDGATTSRTAHYRWPDVSGNSAIQLSGIIQIAYRSGEGAPKPGYIEIAGLQVQDGHSSYRFSSENGVTASYGDSCSCIYSRSADHILVRDNVLTNCGLGFFNWTGSTPMDMQSDTVLRGNYFHDNGIPNQYLEHASYTESDRVIIEHNRFGAMKPGALGSQIKDRSAGTIIRYNYIEQPAGWMIDLVEPEGGYPTLNNKPYYKETWVYSNILLHTGSGDGPAIHWNEDHGTGSGRADAGGKLFFYHNTFAITRNQAEIWKFQLFSVHSGGGSCPPSTRGVIDARNNIWANLPRSGRAETGLMFFAGCAIENFVFGGNWVSPGWVMSFGKPYSGKATGSDRFTSPSNKNPGFVDLSRGNVNLAPGSSAARIAVELAPEVVHNTLDLDLTPREAYGYQGRPIAPAGAASGSDAGAFSVVAGDAPPNPRPSNPVVRR